MLQKNKRFRKTAKNLYTGGFLFRPFSWFFVAFTSTQFRREKGLFVTKNRVKTSKNAAAMRFFRLLQIFRNVTAETLAPPTLLLLCYIVT